ncbi:hypothetical protein [Gordonia westfalica]|nr:hypothetical protein [Gordonia westfalica]
MSGNTITVTAAGVVYARLCVDYAEQSVQVGQSGKLGVGIAGTGSGVVAGVGVVRARYTLTATNTITTDTSSDGRARYTLDATQATTVTPAASTATLYTLTATQDITITQPVVTRPRIELDAAQDMVVAPTASSVPSVGSVNADASQTFEVTSVAVVRVRHTISATQTTTVGQATELGGLRVPLAASQTVAADQTGTARARYTLAALQTINVADTADLRPQLAAANTVTVTGTATSRPRHTLTGTNSAATSSAATATLVTFTRQRMQNGSVSNSFLPYVQVTGFTSDPTYPATVTNNALVVKGAGNVTLTWSATGNGNIKIQRNGVDVGSVGLTGTVSLTVAAGDQLTMWHASNGGPQSVSGCWINITPA